MSYFLVLLSVCFVLGLIGVAANPSPYYGAMGLVFASLGGCGLLVGFGGSFVGLVLLLIYLGGMLVVFAYSVALAADPYPETWGEYSIGASVVGYGFVVVMYGWMAADLVLYSGLGVGGVDGSGMFDLRLDFSGVVELFTFGGPLLLLGGMGLLLALFVVLEVVRGGVRGGMRVP